jgi:hypothetical protein
MSSSFAAPAAINSPGAILDPKTLAKNIFEPTLKYDRVLRTEIQFD